MHSMLAWLCLAFADPTVVTVATSSEQQVVGEVVAADESAWTIKTKEKSEVVRTADVLSITFPPQKAVDPATIEVTLTEGTRLGLTQVGLEGEALPVTSSVLGERKLARTQVASIRLQNAATLIDRWNELTQREKKQDMLVIRKNDVLDFVEGVVAKVTPAEVQILLEGEPVTVKRERVFGVILFQKKAAGTKPVAKAEFLNGDSIPVSQLSAGQGRFKLKHALLGELDVAPESLKRIDFSLGWTWLSDLTPREVKWEFLLQDKVDPYRTDRLSYDADTGKTKIPIKIGDRVFERGVLVHSKTRLRYRLDGDYSRFQAWLGNQAEHVGVMRFELSLDGQKVLDQEVKPDGKQPVRLDLDVKGKFVLEIVVDYGDDDDFFDLLALGDARLVK